MPDALEGKFADLEQRLLDRHIHIGRGIGVPFLLLLYPPSEERRVRRETSTLMAKLRAAGRAVEVVDCNQVLLDTLIQSNELERAIRAERRNPEGLRDFGIGEALAGALVERVKAASQGVGDGGVVFLTRLGALHPFLLPSVLQERLAGESLRAPIVFLVPAGEENGGDYLFLGVEQTRRYRGTYL
ncbi:MAG TPA: BREX protein BrxB domain-containing protein [Chloroflexota bacterium]